VANAETLGDALADGSVFGHLRLRYENVDDDGFARSAHATTARVRLGYETAAYNGFSLGAELEGTRKLDERRNDGVNGRTDLPVIADPDQAVVNQAYLTWTGAGNDGLARDRIVVGRQTLNYETERWIGSVGFRQNDQTFDAVAFETRIIDGVSIRYAYLDRVNRILGDNPGGHWQSDSHAAAITTNLIPRSLVTAYAYILDLKPVPQFSSKTFGLRYDGMWPVTPETSFLLEAEFANQKDAAANPANYSLSYWLIRPALKWGAWSVYAGIERLGGDGVSAIQTPLATLHRHNGWADMFLMTPPSGLRDTHARVVYQLPDGEIFKTPKLDLRVHDFQPAGSGRRYGREFDADLNASVLGWVTVGARYARYDAAAFKADVEKIWLYAEFPL
ncbi:MAG: alginate export family protein, partial [Rhodobacteraceae bacterium]|nr:alginate export family protein [Paracoccaceae bacterium]